ncbi:MAG: carbamoyl-phosphate synthase large subunit [Treponema sp.]|jgi:carbamoylphosphate synthase large subunit|nr:carbamoyl-phosphate synthase large subunit [Treponema sp.]
MIHLPKKVLVLGSGGLKIGQAGEFDYSGSQALKALREEGVASVLINPNIATIQTSKGMADATYFLPVTVDCVRQVIEKERPDGILLGFGGQTALNCGVALDREGVLYKYGVKVLGTPVRAIEDTEDRERFVARLAEIGALSPRSTAVTDIDAALQAAEAIGYPVMVRAAYALGGAGSGICRGEAELRQRCNRAFARPSEAGPPQVLVEEWLGGWKEIEYEVVRDAADNCITVCNMENVDPLGIHTGESIVVAPSQTLTDSEYHKLRAIALKVIRHLGIVGECNIQYALDPASEDYRIIEVNARLSRSSALASKATGYPLAFVAAKLALGYPLSAIENRVTRVTKACFEPALDYVVVKVPRWDLAKFKNVETRIGSEMKSVGEVMSIGRSFEEALQKALRMTGSSAPGLAWEDAFCGPGLRSIALSLQRPTDRRIFIIYRALKEGWTIDRIHRLTKIDKWFLAKIRNIFLCEEELRGQDKSAPPPLASVAALSSDKALLEGKRLIDAAVEWVRKHPLGTASTVIGNVHITIDGIRASFNHSRYANKFYVLPAIKPVLEQGTYLGSLTDFGGNNVENHYFAAPVTLDAVDRWVFVRVRAKNDSRSFYVHEVFVDEEIKKAEDLDSALSKTGDRMLAVDPGQDGIKASDLYRSLIKRFLEQGPIVSSPLVSHKSQQKSSAIPKDLLARAKRLGFSDARIGDCVGLSEQAVRALREEYRVRPAVKQIDTLAAEYPAKTNYLYMTYGAAGEGAAAVDDLSPAGRGVMTIGSGAYRIGSSVEFDWCCVNAAATARALGRCSIMVNCNPETVSTDYDVCDRLYFEELTLERILDIYERERPDGVILSMGGQIPNNLATKLYEAGALIYGTSAKSIDMAEDRNKFSALLDTLGIEQPEWKELSGFDSARAFAAEVGYPVLIRPSYVLSGAAMNVAWNEESLERFLALAADVSPEHPVVISKFIENAKEIEIDAVAKRGALLYHAITEHIENAGVHSGDATVALPAQRLYIETIRKIRSISERIACALDITGPFNIQFLAQRNRVRVIECNLRASRSFPFCSKVSGVNMIDLAVRAMLDEPVPRTPASALDLPWVGVKAAQFSFSRLHGADPVSGVEMASTGEVGCLGSDLNDALLKALLSVGYRIPKKNVLLSTGPIEDKLDFLDSARKLVDMGYHIYASKGTAAFLAKHGIPVTPLYWPLDAKEPNIEGFIKRREAELIINIPKDNRDKELKNNYLIRRMAIDFDIPLFTNIKVARAFIDALADYRPRGRELRSWEEYGGKGE